MHTFREKSLKSMPDRLSDGLFSPVDYGFVVDFQHPLKAVLSFLRRCDLHLPGRGEYPDVEIAAEIDGRLRAEMALIHDLRGNILPEAVNDAVHEDVFTQQRNPARLAVEHGERL